MWKPEENRSRDHADDALFMNGNENFNITIFEHNEYFLLSKTCTPDRAFYPTLMIVTGLSSLHTYCIVTRHYVLIVISH